MVKYYPNGEKVFYRAREKSINIVSPAVQQGGVRQMLWGCMSFYDFGPLVPIEGHIRGPEYLQLLKDHVKPEMDESAFFGRELIFQQDNAKPHKAAAVMEYLQDWGYEVIVWPPQSPDLSPIENIWNIMKMKLKARRPRPRSKLDMKNAMLEIWEEIQAETRKNLILTFKERCKSCVRNKGGLGAF